MEPSPLKGLAGYTTKSFVFKPTSDGDILIDVSYPETPPEKASTVLLHYHGGFLIFGDRYAFLPYWLVNACADRKWIFVTPDYRLMPETTAQTALEDAADAYEWVESALPAEIGCQIGTVLVAGSSAGAFLALATAATVNRQPSALLLIYGLLDATLPRYLTPGTSPFPGLEVDTSAVLAEFPMASSIIERRALTGYPVTPDLPKSSRMALVSALHLEALYLDYMTGIKGLTRDVSEKGVDAIPPPQRNLFPLAFGNLSKLPRTMLVHGQNDYAVSVENSFHALRRLQEAGVRVVTEFPDAAEHGFDAKAGDINIEKYGGEMTPALNSLKRAVDFLDNS